MDCSETIAYIESLSPTLEHPSLKRIEKYFNELGNPQNRFHSLHVGGTNGKGSTIAMLESILRESGARTGRFTGPHLLRWHERFHLNGVPIQDETFARIGTQVRDSSSQFALRHPDLGPLTWFEFLTAMAIFYFLEEAVDVAVMEVGLGGRFDATNVLSQPLCSGITNVSLDHTKILGETIEQIAFEKAGIIKRGVPIVTSAQGLALDVISRRAREVGAPLTIIGAESGALIGTDETDQNTARRASRNVGDMVPHRCADPRRGGDGEDRGNEGSCASINDNVALIGPHQRTNAALALEMLRQSGLLAHKEPEQHSLRRRICQIESNLSLGMVTPKSIARGLANVYWPGRIQFVKDLNLILDGAHNLDGIKTLRNALSDLFPNRTFQFIFGCYENKDGTNMLRELVQKGDSVILTEPNAKRAIFRKEDLARAALELGLDFHVEANIKDALTRSRSNKNQGANCITVVAGSLSLVRDTMHALGWQSVEDGIVYKK